MRSAAILPILLLVLAGCTQPVAGPHIIGKDGAPIHPLDFTEDAEAATDAGAYAHELDSLHALTYAWEHQAGTEVAPVASPLATPGSGLLDPTMAPSDEGEVKLHYLGLATSRDEWNRPIPAYHFLAEEMEYRIPFENGTMNEDNAQWTKVTRHYIHDAVDGRLIGVVNQDQLHRTFPSSNARSPGLQMDFLIMPIMAFRANGAFDEEGGSFSFQALQRDADSNCMVHELRMSDDSNVEGYWDSDVAWATFGRTQVCVQEGDDAPVWVRWDESAEDEDSSSTIWTRTGAGLVLPPFGGDALEPYAYDEQPRETLNHPTGIPVPPLEVLPARAQSDWAGRVKEVAAALYQDPVFIQFLQTGGDNARMVAAGLGLPIASNDPMADAGYDEMSWFTMTTDSSTYMGKVYTEVGGGEQGDRHTAETGHYIEGLAWEDHFDADQTFPVTADIQAQLSALTPEIVDVIQLMPIDRDAELRTRSPSTWQVHQICQESTTGYQAPDRGPVAAVDAERGALLFISKATGGADRCPVA